jgi:hypothetical protein
VAIETVQRRLQFARKVWFSLDQPRAREGREPREGAAPEPKLPLGPSISEDTKTPRNMAPRTDESAEKSPILDRRLPYLTTHRSISYSPAERAFESLRRPALDGPIKTFPLRGIKDSPPYLHDGRLPTLEDTVEFFNLVLETKLTAAEKADLVAFLHAL